MPVIWCGTSTADLISSAATSNTTGAQKDANVSEGFAVAGANIGRVAATFNLDEFWISTYIYIAGGAGTVREGLQFFNTAYSTTNAIFKMQAASGTANMFINYYTGSGFSASSALTLAQGNLCRIDIHCKIADSGGIFEVYLNGSLAIDLGTALSGDTKRTTASTIDRIDFGAISPATTTYSGFILADEDTRPMRLLQLLPTGNGADTSWTGDYTAVDETGFSDADLITSSTVGQHETFTYPDISAGFVSHNIETVCLSGRAQASGSPGTIEGVARVSSTDYTVAPDIAAGASYGPWQAYYDLNPATGNPWTVSEVNAAEFGVRAAA